MYKNRIIQTRLTYSQLHRALTSLGFERRQTPEFTVYREANHDALIVLPPMSDTVFVGDPYLVGIRNIVVGKGIATAESLHALFTHFGGTKPKARGTVTESHRATEPGSVIKRASETTKRQRAKQAIAIASRHSASSSNS